VLETGVKRETGVESGVKTLETSVKEGNRCRKWCKEGNWSGKWYKEIGNWCKGGNWCGNWCKDIGN
jgi:hypothetical protein